MKVFLLILILNFDSGMTSFQYIHNISSRSECEHHAKRLLKKSHYKDFYCMEVFRNVNNLEEK